jgi:hypothetical protein
MANAGITWPAWLSFYGVVGSQVFNGIPDAVHVQSKIKVTCIDAEGQTVVDEFTFTVSANSPIVVSSAAMTTLGLGGPLPLRKKVGDVL